MSRQNVLNKAASQEGTNEIPPNSNKSPYGLWYAPSLDGQKWCAMFVSWVFHHAGHPLGHIQTKNGIHHCQSAHNYYKEKGRITANPQPGDIVIYDWEGNTSTDDDTDGGRVMKRVRSSSLIKSFINPGGYTDGGITPIATTLSKGASGSKVTQIQKHLYSIGYVIKIDGWFGTETELGIKEYQTKNAMTATGVADALTIGALQEDANQIAVAKSKFVSGSYLRRGNVGFMVTEVQRALNAKDPLLNLKITGSFDMATLQAVKAFQTNSKLESDGIVGPKTFGKLGIS